MDMVFYISQKSLDPHTKHGCIVVDKEYTPLSMGYNGPPRGCLDDLIPLTRPEKYAYMVHSEENAILNASRSGVSLKGSTFYITGFPCSRCFRGILNAGAEKIVYGPVNSNCISEEDKKAIELMNTRVIDPGHMVEHLHGIVGRKLGPKITFYEFKGEVGKVLKSAQNYLKEKCDIQV
jgi:dCMP deaminase